MPRLAQALANWIDRLPDTIRPAAYGALFVVLMMLMKGAWLVAPIAIIYVSFTSPHPLADIAFGARVVLLVMFGGAASGLAYGLVGRHLRAAFPGGRYATGIVTIAPYMLVLVYIIRFVDHKPFWAPLSGEDIGIASFMSLLFGTVMGHTWFAQRLPNEEL